ncbi:MAG: hypothetical protein SO147_04020 [Clostridia bacterium]|nr:hypothetical protein [Clostridia bacterium]
MTQFTENKETANPFREEYHTGLIRLLEQRRKEADTMRSSVMEQIAYQPEQMRQELINMLGWPLTLPRDTTPPQIKQRLIAREEHCSIYRMQIEILPGLWGCGLLFLQQTKHPAPFVISQHGGAGTPELCSGLYGSTSNYNNMTRRILQKKPEGNVFAPQLLLWSKETIPVPYDPTQLDSDLKQVGSSITAVELYFLRRCLDYFCTQPYVNPDKLGMVGLSYGGFYTLFAAACDKRIRSAVSCSFFSDRFAYSWPDWVWSGSGLRLTDPEIAALVCPRGLHIAVGSHDDLFDVRYAQEKIKPVREFFQKAGFPHKLRFTVFEGTHEFCPDDSPLDDLFSDLEQESLADL